MQEEVFKMWLRFNMDTAGRTNNYYEQCNIAASRSYVILSHRSTLILSIHKKYGKMILKELGGTSALDERILNWVFEEVPIRLDGQRVLSVSLVKTIANEKVKFGGYYMILEGDEVL